MRKSTWGFSVIELLIVVGIILVIAAIAIPDLLRSRVSANQASAVGSLHTISTAETNYATTYGTGYSPDLASLDGPSGASSATSAGLIDSILGTGVKSAYTFAYAPTSISSTPPQYVSYIVTAQPTVGCGTGNGNCYFTDTTGVIRYNTSVVASSTDSPIGG